VLGACTGVRSISAPCEPKTSSKLWVNFASRSRSTKQRRRPCSSSTSSRLRACWATQAALGLAVTPARWTRRVSSSMKNSTYSRRSVAVSTVKKSHARMPAACWWRNARQVVAVRRGAGSRPWRCSVVRIAVAEAPHAEVPQFALDALVAPARVLCGEADDQLLDGLVERWPPLANTRVGPRARPAMRRRCQRCSASGVTKKHDQRARGRTRLIAASRARSVGSSLGHGIWRRSTPSWWRSTKISKSLAASPRASVASSWMERQSVR
jgi:hypothetical protein